MTLVTLNFGSLFTNEMGEYDYHELPTQGLMIVVHVNPLKEAVVKVESNREKKGEKV